MAVVRRPWLTIWLYVTWISREKDLGSPYAGLQNPGKTLYMLNFWGGGVGGGGRGANDVRDMVRTTPKKLQCFRSRKL